LAAPRGSITHSIRYANERVQFKNRSPASERSNTNWQNKQSGVFAAESALYRTSNFLQEKEKALKEDGMDFAQAKLKAAEEFAIECAMLKVVGSETLDYVVDETVQIYGGMGYSEEAPAARAYRDARINRIFEGTNEINRLLSIDMLLRRAMKGQLDIVGPAWEVQKELTSMPSLERPEGTYGEEEKAVKEFKKAVLMVAGAAAKMQMDGALDMREEQEIIMNVSDMLIDTFIAESLLLRVQKLSDLSNKPAEQAYL
jgi:hypothetical protein